MSSFLRENWLYIVAPLAIILIVLAVVLLTGDDSSSPFIYNIF